MPPCLLELPSLRRGTHTFARTVQSLAFTVYGAFAPYFVVPAANARHIPEGLDPGHASIQDPLGNAIHTLTGGPVEGATVAVHGLGPIGLFAVNAAKAMGASKVIAVDWDNTYRMTLAKELGADLVLGKDDDVVASILAATDGRAWTTVASFPALPPLFPTPSTPLGWQATSTSSPFTAAARRKYQ